MATMTEIHQKNVEKRKAVLEYHKQNLNQLDICAKLRATYGSAVSFRLIALLKNGLSANLPEKTLLETPEPKLADVIRRTTGQAGQVSPAQKAAATRAATHQKSKGVSIRPAPVSRENIEAVMKKTFKAWEDEYGIVSGAWNNHDGVPHCEAKKRPATITF